MGGQPVAAFLSLALPRGFEVAWLDGFLDGFGRLAERFGVELAAVPEGKALLRSGAAGNLYVTGTLGGSAVELEEMRVGAPRRRGPQSFPEPRVGVGLELVRIGVGSCIDLSDGLSTDLRHLCETSGCGVEIWETALPIAAGATLEQALNGGEDYELLLTAGDEVPEEIVGVGVTKIGMMTAETSGIRMKKKDGEWVELVAGGWEHLRG
jgi:thiamine-monophosphate kinase